MDAQELYDLIESLLSDDVGITEASFTKLWDLVEKYGTQREADLLNSADATDGRFYLS